ncbi:MAG: PhzF family phenazine biosynthesis protein [Alphaproteobacteria bacterium]|nr:PhzF family phenazine biosynthesis protein [Alphaproteobacteria bacterium]
MPLPVFQVDAFAGGPFSGNPAAIVQVPEWPDIRIMQSIAAEMNQTTTAFLRQQHDRFALRWFTPTIEEEICGHATLAAAWLVFDRIDPERRDVAFDTRAGPLTVRRLDDGRLEIDFPARPTEPVTSHPDLLAALGGPPPVEVRAARDYLVVYDRPDIVRGLRPDFGRLARTDRHATIVTAPGDDGFDCVSRFFAPGHGISEDHATGAAHASIAPYWTEQLGKSSIAAFQASARGGFFHCTMRQPRVSFAGACRLFLEGRIET